jgi:ATP-dependent RNA helicase MSS116
VAKANDFSLQVLGLPTPPPLEAKTVGKMGLKGVPGLNVQRGDGGGGGKGGGKGGGGGGGGGGGRGGGGGTGKGGGRGGGM